MLAQSLLLTWFFLGHLRSHPVDIQKALLHTLCNSSQDALCLLKQHQNWRTDKNLRLLHQCRHQWLRYHKRDLYLDTDIVLSFLHCHKNMVHFTYSMILLCVKIKAILLNLMKCLLLKETKLSLGLTIDHLLYYNLDKQKEKNHGFKRD